MTKVYEGVQKKDRKVFKHFMQNEHVKFSFKGDTATVIFEEPYMSPTEEELKRKSYVVRVLQQGIIEFRNYCFNN